MVNNLALGHKLVLVHFLVKEAKAVLPSYRMKGVCSFFPTVSN